MIAHWVTVKLSILLCLLLASLYPAPAMQSVTVVAPAKSGERVRIAVLLNGHGEKGVRVDIFRYQLGSGRAEKWLFALTSDAYGWVNPRRLPPGHYHAIALSGNMLRADLYLDVSPDSGKSAIAFPMPLLPSGIITREELIAKAEQKPLTDIVKEFRGVVYDPTGAVIAGASIEVVRKGTAGKVKVANLKSDEKGKFYKRLRYGEYVAIVSMPGFETRFLSFAVTEGGAPQLNVTLSVAPMSEGVSVAEILTHPN